LRPAPISGQEPPRSAPDKAGSDVRIHPAGARASSHGPCHSPQRREQQRGKDKVMRQITSAIIVHSYALTPFAVMICTQLRWRKPILRDRRGQFFPMFSESPALPTKDDLRLHENEALSSVGPDFSEQAQQNAVGPFRPRPLDAPLVHSQLRPQCQILRLKGCAEPKNRQQRSKAQCS